MMWLKSCPRCSTGDMYLDEDDQKHCFQCGFTATRYAASGVSDDPGGDAHADEYERMKARAQRAFLMQEAG
ncbi:MAG: hypothetical protein FJ319_05255 [SAR202 cluster bacterium]|nr:hypothetical protein [SAR202 cluster bacterium]